MWRILPSSCSFVSSPTWSSSGTFAVDPVQLEEVDPLDAEAAQRQLDALPQVARAADRRPHVRALRVQPGLGRDHDVVGVGVQRLARCRSSATHGPVGVGGVEEVDAELDGPPQHRTAVAGSSGGPQMPSPVMRMAPKPRRMTGRSPPSLKVPLGVAEGAAERVAGRGGPGGRGVSHHQVPRPPGRSPFPPSPRKVHGPVRAGATCGGAAGRRRRTPRRRRSSRAARRTGRRGSARRGDAAQPALARPRLDGPDERHAQPGAPGVGKDREPAEVADGAERRVEALEPGRLDQEPAGPDGAAVDAGEEVVGLRVAVVALDGGGTPCSLTKTSVRRA